MDMYSRFGSWSFSREISNISTQAAENVVGNRKILRQYSVELREVAGRNDGIEVMIDVIVEPPEERLDEPADVNGSGVESVVVDVVRTPDVGPHGQEELDRRADHEDPQDQLDEKCAHRSGCSRSGFEQGKKDLAEQVG
ncbi:MAG TPA: hypothetical protein VMU36_12145 [Spirochaetia bacterium]|nr:hypothetical protein [Spirochaetia bacterium]